MNKEETLAFLDKEQVQYELIEHKAVYTMEELNDIHLPYLEADAKNLFVRDDKKRHYYMITIKGNKKVDLRAFEKQFNTRRLSFASDNDLMKYLQLNPGSVTPLGLLNDETKSVCFYIDVELVDSNWIGVHPNENTATVFLKTADLLKIIKEHGNEVIIAHLDNGL